MRLAIGIGIAALAIGAGWAWSTHPSDRREATLGERIYHRGVGMSAREVQGFLGPGGVPLVGATVACANCHGADGSGGEHRGEGAPPIAIRVLGMARSERPGKRARPAYTEESFARAVRNGVDPAGYSLGIAMPRYELTDDELHALWIYLAAPKPRPQLTRRQVKLGLLVPRSPEGALAASASASVLAAVLEEANAVEAVPGTELRLVAVPEGAPLPPVLAWVAGGVLSAEQGRGAVQLAPLELEPRARDPQGGDAFYLYPSLEGQARWLVQQSAGKLGKGALVEVLAPKGPEGDAWVDGARAEARRQGAAVAIRRNLDFLGGPLTDPVPSVVLALGRAPGDSTLPPLTAWPGLTGTPPLPRANHPDPLATHPLLVDTARLEALQLRNHLQPRLPQVERHAYAAAMILFDALSRAGASPTPETLRTALEGVHGLETGVLPPITFGPTRRVGLKGAAWSKFDPRRNGWEVEPRWTDLSP